MASRTRLLWTMVAVVLVMAPLTAVVVALRSPKTMPLSLNPEVYTVYYTGIGVADNSTLLGRRFYRIVAKVAPSDGGGYWEVAFERVGYNKYRGYYRDGTLREEGECYVEMQQGPVCLEPSPDRTKIKNGKYYRPDGTLGSTVENGTGVQTYWHPDGRIRWRLQFKNYARVKLELPNESGELVVAEDYRHRSSEP